MKLTHLTAADAERARAQLEAALASYRVEFLPSRPDVERARFPNLVELYWDLTGPLTAAPPAQEVFATHLYSLAGIRDPAGVRARAYKAWAALVRQHHFELVLRASFPLVIRGHLLDLEGLDFVVIEDGCAYGLALSVRTPAAYEWAAVKRRRHPAPNGLPVLELYLDLDDCLLLPTLPRPLALHRPQQVEEVREWIARLERERLARALARRGARAAGAEPGARRRRLPG